MRIMLTCDHMALCSTGGHTADPVAFLLYEKGKTLSGDYGVLPGLSAVEILNG
jgi:2,3-bisphosphoglycerate-independent phosphoglycerate mutase